METSDYNIILINLDGFRKDKIELCQNLRKFRDDCLYFPNMFTAAPYTFASLASIFSGMYPSKNGVNGYYNLFQFKEQITTLPQILKNSSYFTSCDVIDAAVVPKSGFDEINVFDEKTVDFKSRHEDLIKRLSKKEKFFLFLHFSETHRHLVDAVIQKYKQEDNDDEYFNSRKENEERYNSYLPSCDNYVLSIMSALKKNGIKEKTILIFFADHGTSIGEKRGEKFYGVFTYDYTLNVFCMLKIPNFETKIIDKQCRTIDLYPTIAELAGATIKKEKIGFQGESLIQFLNDPAADNREVFAETGGLYGPWPSPEKHNIFCVRIDNKKLIYNDTPQTWEFYNLAIDSDEENNIYDESNEDVKKMKNRLLFYLNENEIKTNIN